MGVGRGCLMRVGFLSLFFLSFLPSFVLACGGAVAN
jgi:hypothetical protein